MKLASFLGGLTLTIASLTQGFVSWGSFDPHLRFSPRGGSGNGTGGEIQATTGPEAARLCRQMLNEGAEVLQQAQDFRGVMHRQERLKGELGESEALQIKMRKEPLAAYLRWTDCHAGRELLWSPHAHDGMLLVHECGWKGNLVPLVKVAVDDPAVTAAGRHGIHELGLWSLMETLLREQNGLDAGDVEVELSVDQAIGDRDCYTFRITFPKPSPTLGARQVVIYLDKERKFPLGYELYDWPERTGDEAPLAEAYYYEDVEFNVGLTDDDFDPANEDYAFAKKRSRRVASQ